MIPAHPKKGATAGKAAIALDGLSTSLNVTVTAGSRLSVEQCTEYCFAVLDARSILLHPRHDRLLNVIAGVVNCPMLSARRLLQ